MADWRYTLIGYDGAGGNAILMPDLPISSPAPTVSLSGADSFAGTIPSYLPHLDTPAGPLVREWATGIVVERDDQIITVTPVAEVTPTGDSLAIVGVGVTGYLAGQPYRGDRVWNRDDAGLIYAHLWQHVQSYPGANLGVVVPPFTSGRQLGFVPRTPRVLTRDAQARETAAKRAKDNAYAAYDAARKKAQTPAQKKIVASLKVAYDKLTAGYKAAQATLAKAKAAQAKEEAIVQAWNKAMEAAGWSEYRYAWWDNVDVGAKADELAVMGAFDYSTTHSWVGDSIRSTVVRTPRSASRQNPGRFAVGENVIAPPSIKRDGARVATDVIVNGAGEGASTITATSRHAYNTGYLTRWQQIVDKSITTKAVAQQRADEAAKAGTDPVTVGEVVCRDHPNAPHGSVQLGDWIYLIGSGTGYDAVIDRWVRVVQITYDPVQDTAKYTVMMTG